MPKFVHKARVAGGVDFLRAACSVNAQHRHERRCELKRKYQQASRAHQDITVTIQHALGNNSNHPLGSNSKDLIPNHLEERLSDQAQARARTPPPLFWGLSCSISEGMILDV